MQLAHIVYSDRILTYRRMKELDAILDDKPTVSEVKEMAEMRIRNLQAFSELKSFNDNGFFLFEHPLVKCKSERAMLTKLYETDKAEFLKQYSNCEKSLSRYRSYLKKDERKEKRKSDRELMYKYIDKLRLFKEIMK